MPVLRPGQPAPPLQFGLADGSSWSLDAQAPDIFTMIVFYRHRHCSVCKEYLKALDELHADFAAQGTSSVAVSMGSRADAKASVNDFDLSTLPLGHGLSLMAARDWQLFLSAGRRETEPALFCEPGLFLVDRNQRLYFASIQSMPFGRPVLEQVLDWIPKLVERRTEARGEVPIEPAIERAKG